VKDVNETGFKVFGQLCAVGNLNARCINSISIHIYEALFCDRARTCQQRDAYPSDLLFL
jgi:hypothetical protein